MKFWTAYTLKGNWPDYVFEDNYQLPKLSEVEQYIKDKGHLPDMPSADEVADKGIKLGEMDGLLLRKIEELTLYMIRLEQENEKLKEARIKRIFKKERSLIIRRTSMDAVLDGSFVSEHQRIHSEM